MQHLYCLLMICKIVLYQAELQRCQDTITHLKIRYVPHARDPGKDNIIITVRKHTTSDNDIMTCHIML